MNNKIKIWAAMYIAVCITSFFACEGEKISVTMVIWT